MRCTEAKCFDEQYYKYMKYMVMKYLSV